MSRQVELLEQSKLLITRLERISVDSIWARRSSGVRGALLKWVEDIEKSQASPGKNLSKEEIDRLEATVQAGFYYLGKAARERFP